MLSKRKKPLEHDDIEAWARPSSHANGLDLFLGMKKIRHFLSLGSKNLVTGDGNCGFKSGRETLAAHDHDVPEAMTPFRKSIHDWTQWRITIDPPLCEEIFNLSDRPVEGYFNLRSRSTWIQKIWKEGINYDHGAWFNNCFVGKSMIGLLALNYCHTFVVQTDRSSGSTEIYFFNPTVLSDVRVTYISGATDQYHKPLPECIYLVYYGAAHWTYMTLSKKSHFPKSAHRTESFEVWRCCYVPLRKWACLWVEGLKVSGQSDQEVETTHCQMWLWGGMWLLFYVADRLHHLQGGQYTTVCNHMGEAGHILPHWDQHERDFNHQETIPQKSQKKHGGKEQGSANALHKIANEKFVNENQ